MGWSYDKSTFPAAACKIISASRDVMLPSPLLNRPETSLRFTPSQTFAASNFPDRP